MKKNTKQNIIAVSVPAVIIAGIVLAVVFSSYEVDKELVSKEFKKLDFYSEQEANFLEEQGFLTASVVDKITESKEPETREEVAKVLKSLTLVEQNLNSPDEHFEVLATQLDIKNNVYKMAFKLENKSSEQKNFYLIPVSHQNQAVFKGIGGLITEVSDARILSYGAGEKGLQLLAKLYDVNQHKAELKKELAQAYDDIGENNYQAQAVEVTIKPNSAVVAQSEWEVLPGGDKENGLFESVYFLVYGSAGGARDELTILNVRSHPEQGENWIVFFYPGAG